MKKYEKYKGLKDMEVIKKIREGDDEAKDYLRVKYEGLFVSVAMRYEIEGCSMEEKKQILSVGFTKAINGYRSKRSENFTAYAKKCMENEMNDFCKALYAAKRNGMQVDYLYSNVSTSYDRQLQLIDILKDDAGSPEDIFINSENEIWEMLIEMKLPPEYYEVLRYKVMGKKHDEIAIALDIKKSRVDYIMSKFRKILKKYKK